MPFDFGAEIARGYAHQALLKDFAFLQSRLIVQLIIGKANPALLYPVSATLVHLPTRSHTLRNTIAAILRPRDCYHSRRLFKLSDLSYN